MNDHDDLETFERFARRLRAIEAEVPDPPPWRVALKVRPRTRAVGPVGTRPARTRLLPAVPTLAVATMVVLGAALVATLLNGLSQPGGGSVPLGSASPSFESLPASPCVRAGELVVVLDGLNAISRTTIALGPAPVGPRATLEPIQLVSAGTYQVDVSWVDPSARTRPPLASVDARLRRPDGSTVSATARIAGPGVAEVTLPAGEGTADLEFEVTVGLADCPALGASGAFAVSLVPGPPAGAIPVPSFAVWRQENGSPVGCDAIGVGDPVTGVLRGDPADPALVWLVNPDGRRISVVWPEGFAVTFSRAPILYDETGRIVGRDGETLELGQVSSASAAGTASDPYYASGILFQGCYPRRGEAISAPTAAPTVTISPDLAGCPRDQAGFLALAVALDRTIRLGGVSVPLVTAGIGLRSGDYWADDLAPAWAGFDPRDPLTVRLTKESSADIEIAGSPGMELTDGRLRYFPAGDYDLAAGQLPDLGAVGAGRLELRDGLLVWPATRGRWLVAVSVRWQTACLAGDGTAYALLEVGAPG